jgi:hypothetical protein
VLFSKFNTALNHHDGVIKVSAEKGTNFDYEAELVIVIGRTGRNISEADALKYVFGYCTGNDFTARDLQARSTQWLLGKSLDGSGVIGPWLVTWTWSMATTSTYRSRSRRGWQNLPPPTCCSIASARELHLRLFHAQARDLIHRHAVGRDLRLSGQQAGVASSPATGQTSIEKLATSYAELSGFRVTQLLDGPPHTGRPLRQAADFASGYGIALVDAPL